MIFLRHTSIKIKNYFYKRLNRKLPKVENLHVEIYRYLHTRRISFLFFSLSMILYIESQVRQHPRTLRILQKFPQADVIEIFHYKNIFDKHIVDYPVEDCYIIA
jgi:hypothetical protein